MPLDTAAPPRLTPAQCEAYARDGYLVLPNLFSAAEVAAMKADLARIQTIDTDHLVRERAGGVAKTIYRVHEADGPTASPLFHAASRAPRLLGPARQLLGDDSLYIYHTKCNLKTAIDGSVWQWHQDYGSWRRDGVPQPDLTTALVMLDQPSEMSGCLYFIPGSHRLGTIEPEMDDRTTSYRLWVVPKPKLVDIMQRSPEPVPIIGPPGTVVFFHCNILHGSGHNLSRHDRWAVYLVYNRCANRPLDVPGPRPDYVRSLNWAPLPMGSDALPAGGA
ncbi:phytanoyl-CoA dioxygenase family protein [Falsiroseomonas selenitidurans]|uniref:Phytanoyl-CoA dioxygenase n=1 Tax=Falsiroseomonas selenitidurans TaxID=2716335 RepID=A0ABX1DWY5_9PROT|nr:phytanoyl-CoA dioxygenase family protein [Falsiroseomonas selenitidurans]NKC29406.1 phytanoyl-CoA dioxygenase [Falsiroseomonas selenitidurans]